MIYRIIVVTFFVVLYQYQTFSQDLKTIIQERNEQALALVKGLKGTYANPPRSADGQIDQKRLIRELKGQGANTYHWLTYAEGYDLEVLKQFLPKARKAGLDVWITLLPPSESPPIQGNTFSEPYRLDFERWAIELAKLSLSEPNLIAWSIDDFVHNLKFFTPDYVEKFVSAARKINPRLLFIPCCYYKQTTPEFAKRYAHLLDGILFPYRAESAGFNLTDPALVENEINEFRKMFGPGFPVILDIYASPHSSLGSTTANYVRSVLTDGLRIADGVFIYRHQDPVKDAEKYKIIRQGFRKKV